MTVFWFYISLHVQMVSGRDVNWDNLSLAEKEQVSNLTCGETVPHSQSSIYVHCHEKPNDSICLLYKWAVTAFWLCRAVQFSGSMGSMVSVSLPWFCIVLSQRYLVILRRLQHLMMLQNLVKLLVNFYYQHSYNSCPTNITIRLFFLENK